ncbi:MAG: glycosyltransferase family 4 protein [Phycisphaerae bacterium]
MKICHVITRLIVGGAQENTLLTCRGLHERGHDVTLIAGPETGPEGSLWDAAETIGCRLVRIDSLRRAIHPTRDVAALSALIRSFRKLRPDIVHTHSSKAGILGRLAAHRAGVPRIIHTIHGMSFNRAQSGLRRFFFRELEALAAGPTHHFITVADAMRRQSVDAGIAAPERFTTIRSGMDTDAFRPDARLRSQVRKEWHIAEDDVVVGTIARLFDNKGYDEIIAAMPTALARCPRLRFVWIGDGARRNEYAKRLTQIALPTEAAALAARCRKAARAEARGSGVSLADRGTLGNRKAAAGTALDRVHFTGLVAPSAIPRLVNGLDIVLHASRWEGLPRALVQGLLTEVPAISFDNDGAPEVVVDGETGLLIPYGDIAALADAIVRLSADASLRKRLGQEGRRRCVEEFHWQTMVDRIEEVYEGP